MSDEGKRAPQPTAQDPNPPKLEQRILYLFTRTPLHVGAGASVGAIDQPIQRERHTGFPIIPATSLKGSFADAWNGELKLDKDGKPVRIVAEKQGEKWIVKDSAENAAWLFGSDNANIAWEGALQFCEARLIALPIRSAKGSFAWITCPLILARAARDGVKGVKALTQEQAKCFSGSDGDVSAIFPANGPLSFKVTAGKEEKMHVVLEEYTFTHASELPTGLGDAMKDLFDDAVWQEVASRLVILSNGMMSFFAQNACEVAQHVRIDDTTGTAADQALFNQENVPSEALFYATVHFFKGRGEKFKNKTPQEALRTFQGQDGKGADQPNRPGVRNGSVFQFGGDATTGLGYCTVYLP